MIINPTLVKKNFEQEITTKNLPDKIQSNFLNNQKLFEIANNTKHQSSEDNKNKNTKSSNGASLIQNKANCLLVNKTNPKSSTTEDNKAKNTKKNEEISQTQNSNQLTNSLNINVSNSIIANKKHLTTSNSPSHFPFNFNKDNIQKVNAISDNIEKDKNISANKKDEITSLKSKQIASLKLNFNFKSGENSKKELLKNTNGVNSKEFINTGTKVLNQNNFNKNNQILSDKKNKKYIEVNNHNTIPSNVDCKLNTEISLENALDNSTTSISSTIRESNYYKKEAEKLSTFIKNYYSKNEEYPPTTTNNYKFGRLLGRGAFGKVNLGLNIITGRLVAIKTFNKTSHTSENAKRKIYQETNLMKTLKHNSIVKIFEIFETQKYILLTMEYVCGGDLLSFVRKRTKLNETTAKFIFRQIMEAIQYIHSQNIIHRDIKPDNILIDLSNNVKICDFGVSKQIKRGETMHDQCISVELQHI